LEDHALFDTVVNDGNDEDDDSATQDFIWENMENCKGQRENFTGSAGPQCAAKHVMEIVDVFELFFSKELTDTIVKETNRYKEQFLHGHELSVRSPARAYKLVTEGEIYIVLGLFMLMGIIQKPTLRSYFTTKRGISTLGFREIITRERLELICTFLHFADNETITNFEGPKKLFNIFPLILHLNNKFQESYLPNRAFQLMNH
jgi:hypothetical protein